jgi:hypothetical protein
MLNIPHPDAESTFPSSWLRALHRVEFCLPNRHRKDPLVGQFHYSGCGDTSWFVVEESPGQPLPESEGIIYVLFVSVFQPFHWIPYTHFLCIAHLRRGRSPALPGLPTPVRLCHNMVGQHTTHWLVPVSVSIRPTGFNG